MDPRSTPRRWCGRAAGGDTLAQAVWREAIAALAFAVASAQALCDLELVVVGGGMARDGAALLVPLADGLAAHLGVGVVPAVVGATLGSASGVVWGGPRSLAHELGEEPRGTEPAQL